MGKIKWYIISFLLLGCLTSSAQKKVKKTQFFLNDSLITLDLSSDLKKLISEKKLDTYQPAKVTLHFPDSSVITENIRLSARGEFRRKYCRVPTMKFDFRNPGSSQLSSLKKLKLVCGCDRGIESEALILKEYLVYKIYNLLTDMSFRVRLLRINYQDTRNKLKPYSQYAFLVEDVDEMARRNKCYEVEKLSFRSDGTSQEQMTLVAIFQYMIGNTDWAIPNYHNIKLMRPVTDSFSMPYTIPYDFDFCGLVNANYASPPEELGISSVRERAYRGYTRSMEQLQSTLEIFRKKREAIKDLVMNFELLSSRDRREIMTYLDEFYDGIESKWFVERNFIQGAREK